LADKSTILLYGRTNSGKTAQIGVLAEHIYKTLGKRTRLYTADKGGTKTIAPYVKLGLIEVIDIENTDPWLFLMHAANGHIRSDKKWIPGDLSGIGMVAFESFRSFAEELLMWLAKKAGEGANIGGGSNVSFVVQSEGEQMKVGGSNQSHYKIVQDRMTTEIWQSQKLDVPYILWTSSVSKDESQLASGKVLGPDVIGKALTEEVPRWFSYTFRLDVLPAQGTTPEKHVLYLGTHQDVTAGNAAALGNIRKPLDAPELKEMKIEPADLVKAIGIVEGGYDPATAAIRKRLGL
jgi:hypothetical protein